MPWKKVTDLFTRRMIPCFKNLTFTIDVIVQVEMEFKSAAVTLISKFNNLESKNV